MPQKQLLQPRCDIWAVNRRTFHTHITSIPQSLTSEQLKDLLEQRMVVYNNLAAAQLKIDAVDAAMK